MAWTTKSYSTLLGKLAEAQQAQARAEGEVKRLEETVASLLKALGELGREKELSAANAKIAQLEAQLRSVLERATAPSAVVPALFGNGQR